MVAPKIDIKLLKEALTAHREHPESNAAAARFLGLSPETYRHRLRRALDPNYCPELHLLPNSVDYPELAESETNVEEILERGKKRFLRLKKAADSRKWMKFKVNATGPFGLVFVGDPHLDDNGCNLELLERDVKTMQATPNMWGVGMGDYTNNWAGRLQRLYGEQETTIPQAWKLAEWLFGRKKPDGSSIWWVLLKGNHDLWSGQSDPLDWMARGAAALEEWRVNFKIVCPNGQSFKVDAAHNHKGHSQFNTLHGPKKAALFTGAEADIYVSGDRHNWAMMQEEDQYNRGRVYWSLRCRGYKWYDNYSEMLGFGCQENGASITAIFDPQNGSINCFSDVVEAADFLRWKTER